MSESDEEVCQINILEETIGRLVEFFEICINQLLYLHKIYPLGVFSKKQIYGTAVQSCDHPKVNEYINKCLETATGLLQKGELKKLNVIFISQDNELQRKFTFDVKSLQLQAELHNECDITRLELDLRDAFMKLSICDRQFPPILEGSTFKILLETSEDSFLNICRSPTSKEQYEFPWVQSRGKVVASDLEDLIPVSFVESKGISFHIFAQERKKEKIVGKSDDENTVMSEEY